MKTESIENEILSCMQYGIRVCDHPFQPVAEKCGVTEAELLYTLENSFRHGLIRRFGGVFNAASLGYTSILAAADIPEKALSEYALRLNPHPGITHSYARSGKPALWFTLTAHQEEMDAEKKRIEHILEYPVYWMPSIKRYKVQVIFNLSDSHKNVNILSVKPENSLLSVITEQEKNLIRLVQETLPLVPDLFGDIAARTGYTKSECMATLSRWLENGTLRRIGIILRHHETGIRGNGMAVWQVDPTEADRFGEALSALPDVTHCYLRNIPEPLKGNLYAMLYARTPEALIPRFEEITTSLGLPKGELRLSLKEFKKTSPHFFTV